MDVKHVGPSPNQYRVGRHWCDLDEWEARCSCEWWAWNSEKGRLCKHLTCLAEYLKERTVNQYRKKPVSVEAIRVPMDGALGSRDFMAWGALAFFMERCEEWQIVDGLGVEMRTVDGNLATAKPGDWIIRGVQDEYYPCQASIFAATYDAV